MSKYIPIYIGQADFIEGYGGIGDPGSAGYVPWD